jgi:hypothetical protein
MSGKLTNLKRGVATSADLADGPFGERFTGNKWYFKPYGGNDNNEGTRAAPFATLNAAYNAATDGNNDVIYYIAGASDTDYNFSTAFTWSKSYTHLVGVCAPVLVGPRARFFQTSTATGLTSMFTVSGTGNSFWNIELFQGVADATSLYAATVSGGRNYFNRCQISGMGDATQGGTAGARSLVVSGGENMFEDCYIGLDTVARSAGNVELEISGADAPRNVFRSCILRSYATSADHRLVKFGANAFNGGFLMFDDCLFHNDTAAIKTSALALDYAMDSHAAPNGNVILKNCMFVGCSAIADDYTAFQALGICTDDDIADYSSAIGYAVAPTA